MQTSTARTGIGTGMGAWLRWGAWRTMWQPDWVFVSPSVTAGVLPGVLPGAPPVHGPGLPVPAHDQALLAWRDWCAAHAGQRCKVALSSQWVMCGVVADDVAANQFEAIAAMALQWDHYGSVSAAQIQGQQGAQAQQDQSDWLLRVTRAPGAWLVCATPRRLVDDLKALAQAHGVSVAWMGPWWVSGARRWLRHAQRESGHAGLRACEPGWSLCMQVHANSLQRVWAEPVAPGAGVGIVAGLGVESIEGTAMAHAQLVSLRRHGAAAAACVWDDPQTSGLLSGRDAAWGRAA